MNKRSICNAWEIHIKKISPYSWMYVWGKSSSKRWISVHFYYHNFHFIKSSREILINMLNAVAAVFVERRCQRKVNVAFVDDKIMKLWHQVKWCLFSFWYGLCGASSILDMSGDGVDLKVVNMFVSRCQNVCQMWKDC